MRTIIDPRRQAHDARNRAALLRSEADELRDLLINDTAQRIEAKCAAQEQAREDATQRARELHDPFEHDPRRTDPSRDGPTRSR